MDIVILMHRDFDIGYIADYDLSINVVSNWTEYSYNNLPADSVVSHFEGITSDSHGGYNLAADVVKA